MRRLLIALGTLPLLGCGSMIANMVGDALAGTGTVYSSDDDPELVGAAIPFGLKTYESVLAEVPRHEGLLLAAASGFSRYAYAYVVQEADRIDDTDLTRARELRERARRLFLRGRDYALRGLEVRHPGLSGPLKAGSTGELSRTTKEDARFLYWAGVSWAAALMVNKGDLSLMADLPTAAALVRRVVELDPAFGDGAAHEFFISYDGSRSEAMGGSRARAREHYAKTLELSGGRRASVHLALAESVSVAEQNLAEFRALLDRALAVDPDAEPSQRLPNVIARRRAGWLKTRIPDLFVEADVEEEKR